ncbi:MAG TPA: BatA domain-containing protein, partial [Bryobacteraceae bacterium]|nr:BatA domain-containing protein [Bryobacteraceae bacterium]
MFLLNLSLPEFLALFGALSGIVVTLYLLSRARRRQRVATLQFWQRAMQPVPSTRRRRIQNPWSLVLQLLSLLLLLLAIAQLKFGDRDT